MRRRWPWVVGLVLVAVGGLGLLLAEAPGGSPPAADGGPASPGSGGAGPESRWLEIPASNTAFETLRGTTESLEDYRGRIVLLNFWGTWCPPCRREIPELVAVDDSFPPEDLAVIGVAVDSGSPEEIRAFLQEFGADYPVWISSGGKALASFDAAGYPFTLLIDRRGVIRRQYLGPQHASLLAEHVRALIEREARARSG